MSAYRILIADDHEVVRHGLRSLLQSQPEWIVCGEAANGGEAAAKSLELRPDLVILDLGLPDRNGLEVTREIVAAAPAIKVLILSLYESEQMVDAAVQAGARGYLLKSDASRYLVKAAETLRHGKLFFTPKFDHLVQPPDGRRYGENDARFIVSLTPRELEVVRLLGEGKNTRQVAQALSISVKTAETHRAHVMHKLDLHSIAELVMYAVRNKIIPLASPLAQ